MRPYYFLGVTFANKKDYPAAAKAFEKARALAPGNDSVKFNLAVLYRYHLDRREEAAALFAEVAASPVASESLKEKARVEMGGK